MMKRRSFLASLGAGIAALVVPTVAARQTGPAVPGYLTDPDAWHLFDKPGGGKTLWVDDFLFSRDLTEAALEDIIIEIDEFRSERRKLIAFEPTRLWCYPEDRKAAFKLMGI